LIFFYPRTFLPVLHGVFCAKIADQSPWLSSLHELCWLICCLSWHCISWWAQVVFTWEGVHSCWCHVVCLGCWDDLRSRALLPTHAWSVLMFLSCLWRPSAVLWLYWTKACACRGILMCPLPV
jgi:hypothetical protein